MPRERVLVAEPDALQRQLVDMLLAPDAMQLTMVASGREALEHLREATPDLAVLALDLPDMAGDEICAKIKKVKRLKHVPVILVAEQTHGLGLSEADRARGEHARADLTVPRPLGDKNLRERVRRLVQASAEARDEREPRQGASGDGATTRVIDEALGALGSGAATGPEGGESSADATRASGEAGARGAGGTGFGRNAGASGTPEAPMGAEATADGSDAAAPPATGTPAPDSSAAPSPHRGAEPAPLGPSSEARAMREELSALKMENRQLQRKLQVKQEELNAKTSPKVNELQRQVKELERRNKALLDAIEDLKRRRGGLFGRGSA